MPNSRQRRPERSLEDYNRRLVVFDTNVIESRYLAPLLRGETCRDFARLREHEPPYVPAIFVKSYYEICHHVKRGTKSFPWLEPGYGFPGGMETGRSILSRLRTPTTEADLYWWFNMAEEWRGRNWDDYQAEMCSLVASADRDDLLHELSVQREFATWKFSLSAFCQRIWAVLEAELTILTHHDVHGFDGEYLNEVFQLEQELAERCLIPSEDFELVTAALACRASAFVTGEKELLLQTGWTVDLNWKTAFVHPDHLVVSVDENFLFRTSSAQHVRRANG